MKSLADKMKARVFQMLFADEIIKAAECDGKCKVEGVSEAAMEKKRPSAGELGMSPQEITGPWEELVELLYCSIFRRPPDKSGLEVYIKLLESGEPVTRILRLIMSSPEFKESHLAAGAPYSFRRDPLIQKHLNEAVEKTSEWLAREAAISPEEFADLSLSALDSLAAAAPDFAESQKGYLDFHLARFRELDNLILLLNKRYFENSAPRLLDFGVSVNTFILSKLLPAASISIADRPNMNWTQRIPSLIDGCFEIDLAGTLDGSIGRLFDIIVFTEVIEHITANPVNVLRFLFEHLAQNGFLILTTPNVFSSHKLLQIGARQNPVPVIPKDYKAWDAPHLHVREYCISELLDFVVEAGGVPAAFFFSSCWDENASNDMFDDRLGNIVIIATASPQNRPPVSYLMPGMVADI